VRQGLRFLRQQLPEILAKRIDVLSPRMIRIVEDLSGDWRRLDERNKLARIAWKSWPSDATTKRAS
jgi:hypothetical protein